MVATQTSEVTAELTATRDRLRAIADAAEAELAQAQRTADAAAIRLASALDAWRAVAALVDDSPAPPAPDARGGGRDEDDDDAFRGANYDRDMAAAVEAAERAREDRNGHASGNGHPIDAHVDRVGRLAECGGLELPDEDDQVVAETPADDERTAVSGHVQDTTGAAAKLREIAAAARRDPPAPGVSHARDAAAAKKREPAAGPATSREALALACRMTVVSGRLDELRTAGATDAEILDALKHWPTHRVTPASGAEGEAWGVAGGEAPAFYFGAAARGAWADRRRGLSGTDLAVGVRGLLKIPHPPEPDPAAGGPHAVRGAADPPPARAARKSDGEPIPAGTELPAGYRSCTRAEYRAAPAADRHERFRAVRAAGSAELDRVVDLRVPDADLAAPPEETPAGGPAPAAPTALAAQATFREPATPADDDELDRLLIHACRTYYPQMQPWWDAAAGGALDDAIRDLLVQHWPQGRVFVGPDQTRQKHGYTISRAGNHPCLWVGAFQGPGHRADLAGAELIARVRAVFGIPDPAAARSGVDLVTSRPGSTPAANGVTVPGKPSPPAKRGALPLGGIEGAAPRQYCADDRPVTGRRRKEAARA